MLAGFEIWNKSALMPRNGKTVFENNNRAGDLPCELESKCPTHPMIMEKLHPLVSGCSEELVLKENQCENLY